MKAEVSSRLDIGGFLPLSPLWGEGRVRGAAPRAHSLCRPPRCAAPHLLPPPHKGGEGNHQRAFGLVIACAALVLAACGQPAGVRDSVILAADPAPKLADYGLFKDAAAREPAEGVTPYDLVNALFSDHAGKHRLVYVPKGKQASYAADGVFDFPVGSVLVKTFAFAPDMRQPAEGERYIETRLLIHKAGGWVAYPYIWNAEETEATYAPVGGRVKIDTISAAGEPLALDYHVPNRNQCKLCHSSDDTLIPIGPTARSLNHEGPAGVGQLEDWAARGILAGLPADPPAAPPAFGDAPLEQRARAWLDINCAHCHRAGGGASNSGLFLAWNETNPTGWGIHKRPTAAGRGSGNALFVIEPGRPEASILVHRMESNEPGVMMPELGRTVVDAQGLALMRDWIAAMPPVE
jgi:uncharacterized repeat protein (TIGR03806 family)